MKSNLVPFVSKAFNQMMTLLFALFVEHHTTVIAIRKMVNVATLKSITKAFVGFLKKQQNL